MANVLAIAGPNSKYALPGAKPAGFWAGLWHGLISGITFFVSLFKAGVRIYEVHNRGPLYDLGFLIGVSAAVGGGGSSASRVAGQ
jgi:hypothetical protein